MNDTSVKNSDLKSSATDFLRLAAFGKVDEAFERYVAAGFIHHNPYFRGDRESLKAAMAEAAEQSPNDAFDIHHVLGDGDFVAVHSMVRQRGQAAAIAVVHLCRFENGLIAELWDVVQVEPEESPNERGMF